MIIKTFMHFIESFLMIGAGYGVLGKRFKIKDMLIIASIYGFCIYGIRAIYIKNNIPFGTHTLILLFLYTSICKIKFKTKLIDSILATMISFGMLILGEGVFLIPAIKFLNLDVAYLYNTYQGIILGNILNWIPLIILFVICYVFKIAFINMNLLDNEK